jgi:hypothetical protein
LVAGRYMSSACASRTTKSSTTGGTHGCQPDCTGTLRRGCMRCRAEKNTAEHAMLRQQHAARGRSSTWRDEAQPGVLFTFQLAYGGTCLTASTANSRDRGGRMQREDCIEYVTELHKECVHGLSQASPVCSHTCKSCTQQPAPSVGTEVNH